MSDRIRAALLEVEDAQKSTVASHYLSLLGAAYGVIDAQAQEIIRLRNTLMSAEGALKEAVAISAQPQIEQVVQGPQFGG